VGKETEWLSQTPCREGVGREAGVNQSQTACKIIIGQVRIVLTQLKAAQHTLIYDVRIRQRTDIEIRIADTFLDALADEIEGALEDWHLIICHTCNEHLFDGRFIAQCSLTQTVWIGRYIAEMHQLKSLTFNLFNHNREDILLFLLILRQEDKTCTIFSLFRYRDTLKKNKLMWNLEHDTGTITRLVIGTLSTTMAHILEDLQGVIDQLMTLVTVDIHHHTYATRIVFIGRTVQSFFHFLFVLYRLFLTILLLICLLVKAMLFIRLLMNSRYGSTARVVLILERGIPGKGFGSRAGYTWHARHTLGSAVAWEMLGED